MRGVKRVKKCVQVGSFFSLGWNWSGRAYLEHIFPKIYA